MTSPACPTLTALALALALTATPAAAQSFDPDRWTGGTTGDGTYRLTCRPASACTADTFLSFTPKPPRAVTNAEAYERLIAGALPELKKRGIAAETTPATRATLGRFTLYRATRTLTLPDGRKQYYVAGMLVGDEQSVSLFAVAPRADLAAENFAAFSRWLADHPPEAMNHR